MCTWRLTFKCVPLLCNLYLSFCNRGIPDRAGEIIASLDCSSFFLRKTEMQAVALPCFLPQDNQSYRSSDCDVLGRVSCQAMAAEAGAVNAVSTFEILKDDTLDETRLAQQLNDLESEQGKLSLETEMIQRLREKDSIEASTLIQVNQNRIPHCKPQSRSYIPSMSYIICIPYCKSQMKQTMNDDHTILLHIVIVTIPPYYKSRIN